MSTLPENAASAAKVPDTGTVLHQVAAKLDLDSAISHFIATADGLSARRPESHELTTIVYQLAAVSQELFPGKLTVETAVDPEIRDDVCVLFQVDASGTIEEIMALNDRWHRRLVSIAPQWSGLFRLSIFAR
jgi:hypothetical protein